jgi:hypothetical protein
VVHDVANFIEICKLWLNGCGLGALSGPEERSGNIVLRGEEAWYAELCEL